jgi:type VI secretion system secreted protein VgrG
MATGTIALEAEFTSPLGEGALKFRRMNLQEQLGRLPACHVELVRPSKDAAIVPGSLLGQKATVKLLLEQGQHRFFNGWVTRFERGGVVGRHDVYRLELRPWLWYLTLGQDSRIFQTKTAMEIIQAVFGEYGQQQFENKVTGTLRSRNYCVQYRETDFAFVSRLMEEEGVYYYFKHSDGNHSMVLCNGAAGHSPIPGGSLSWAQAQTDDRYREDVIQDWAQADSVGSLKYVHRDYDYVTPAPDRTKDDSRTLPVAIQGDGEVFDFPGRHAEPGTPNDATGTSRAGIEVDIFESGHVVATGVTRHRVTAVGSTFTFKDYPTAGTTSDWLITKADYEMEFGDYEADKNETSEGFACRFEAVPKSIAFQPQPITPKPIVRGPQTAVVVGPGGEEIHTEEHGRVKVQFRWDRVGTSNENSSCWIRVATPWASKGFGMISLPRIGDEVVVSFLEGDPDRPLITGSVYNGVNKSAYTLPANQTVSGIRSRSSKEGSESTFNEIRFEDKKGSEYIWVHAEKNLHTMVENSAFTVIGNELHSEVKKNAFVKVGENVHVEVLKKTHVKLTEDSHVELVADLNAKLGGALHLKVVGAVEVKSDDAIALDAAQAFDIKAGQNLNLESGAAGNFKASSGIVIDGGSQVTIKGGSGTIVLDSSGVTITGPMVKINSGGGGAGAASAKAANPTAPTAPTERTENTDPLSGGTTGAIASGG